MDTETTTRTRCCECGRCFDDDELMFARDGKAVCVRCAKAAKKKED